MPLAEELGLLSLAANNQQLLVNGVAPLLVEGAPFLLPVVAGALEVGPPAFYLAAATFGGLEAALIATDAHLPLVGLNAAVFLGLLLVPLTAASAAAGAQSMLLALQALGYGGILLTGPNAHDLHVKRGLGLKEEDEIVAFLYTGTPSGRTPEKPRPDPKDFVAHWPG